MIALSASSRFLDMRYGQSTQADELSCNVWLPLVGNSTVLALRKHDIPL